MNIHGICLIKNEIDIIAQMLEATVPWCDFIYVYDNGSTDGTWETVLALSQKYPHIVPYKQDDAPFSDSLRGEVFRHYRQKSIAGDWWARLDADEFYVDNPRSFLAKVPLQYSVVVAAFLQYYFTDKDLEQYNQDSSLYANEIPVQQKCRYYINNWADRRFFRYAPGLSWPPNKEWPDNPGRPYSIRIRAQHFQYRSPQQIQKRLDMRHRVKQATGFFSHESRSNLDWITQPPDKRGTYNQESSDQPITWQQRVVPAATLNYDAHDGQYVINEALMPPLEQPLWSRILGTVKSRIKRLLGRSS